MRRDARSEASAGALVEDSYPLAPLQQAMLIHDLASARPGSYIQHAICDLREPIDVALLERTWRTVSERHAILRTAFRIEGIREPVQEVLRGAEVDWIHSDWSSLPPDEQEARFDAHVDADGQRDFEPKGAPPMRLATFRLGREHHRLLWTYHHALLDGRAVRIVLRELLDRYDALSEGRELQLPPPEPYRHYIDWLARQDSGAAARYWQQALAGAGTPTSLATPRPERSGGVAAEGYAAREIRLTRQSTDALRSLARERQLTLNTLLMGAWAQLLGRYSGESAVTFGTTLALRGSGPDAFREMVGLLINTVPVRVDLPPGMLLSEWLGVLRSQWLDMRAHSWAPLTKIRQWGGIARENAPFSSLVVYEHAQLDSALGEERRNWTTRRFGRRSGAAHPLTLAVFGEPELSLKLVYDRSLFDPATIVPMLEHLRIVLEGTVTGLEKPLRDQPLLADAETKRILVEWNATDRRWPSEICTHLLVERQVERAPEAIAVDGTDRALTYRQLNDRSNQLAHYLRRSGVAAGTLVGICMERCPELIVAMLAIMKAGGAYLALDASNPPERLDYIFANADLSIVIATETSAPRAGALAGRVIVLDRESDRIALESTANPSAEVGMEDPAYAVYTSGSTGQPKGMRLSHRALTNHTLAMIDRYGVSAADRRLQFVSIGSDVLIADVFPLLVAGGAVVLRPEAAILSIREFLQFLEYRKVTITGLPSAYWHEWVTSMSDQDLPFPSSLRLVVSGMDSVRADLFALWKRKASKGVRWVNAYGPSEATCTATLYEADLSSEETGSIVPIGRPLPNVRVYILDAQGRPVPVGVPGEIHVGGIAVARGYLNRPDLTSEKFVPDVFGAQPGMRLYKTGDIARYRPDGNIEFLGRVDDQVKIRGFRVEPAEIEAALQRLPQVRETCVVARGANANAKRLIAYVVPAPGTQASASDLRALLRRALPEYMVPVAIVFLPVIPLTLNGKVDHAALPEPDRAVRETGQSHASPTRPLERALAAIWEELLQTRVGVSDNFFDLGGDSLRGVQLIDKVLADFGVAIPVDALFDDAATVADMAARIELERARSAPRAAIPTIQRRPA